MMEGLVVNQERMRANLNLGGGIVFSQRVLLALIEKGMARDTAYRVVQAAALRAWDENKDFRKELLADERVTRLLTRKEVGALFDESWHLRNLDTTFRRVGLAGPEGDDNPGGRGVLPGDGPRREKFIKSLHRERERLTRALEKEKA